MTGRRALASLVAVCLSVVVLAAQTGGGGVTTGGTRFLGGTITNPILFPDGTSPLPSMAFASEPTLGFWRSAATTVTLQGSLNTTGEIKAGATTAIYWNGRAVLRSPANGIIAVNNNAETIGSELKVDALPTVSSGFGTSPSITAGSTPLAGSINVGTGGVATTGVILFNGTAFPSAPFCDYGTTTTNAVTRGTPTTTQLTLNSTTAWTASDIVSWHCISSK